jgi:hypothetical protein
VKLNTESPMGIVNGQVELQQSQTVQDLSEAVL